MDEHFVGVIGSAISWIFFLFALGMLKDFIAKGFGFAIGEFLFKNASPDQREKIIRYFGKNGEEIKQYLKSIQDRLDGKEVK